jgi:glucose/mannose-6-phosphate isomerase
MKSLVENFPKQLREAISIGQAAKLPALTNNIQNILISGLGGSGIGGTIVSEIVSNTCPVPVVINKDYFLPEFVGPKTLVVVSSYSGNTEETLQAMEEAIAKNAMIVCISSGGKIAERAKAHGFGLITIPGGMPPRSCLGYSLTQLFFILKNYNLTGNEFIEQLTSAIELIENDQSEIIKEATEVSKKLIGKLPVIYAVDGYNGVATRFRQQINENSKMLCWHHILPEMNHNELVGWTEEHPEIAVVILRNDDDYSRTQTRIEISKTVFKKYTNTICEIYSKGKSKLERSVYLIHLTDWISVLIAESRNIDATEVNIINHLKGELAKI